MKILLRYIGVDSEEKVQTLNDKLVAIILMETANMLVSEDWKDEE